MDTSEYGPFASIIGVAAALIATFSLLLLKSVGRVAQWTWLLDDTPPFLVTVGVRGIAVALIGASFILIDQSNYIIFTGVAVVFGIAALMLIVWFDRLRRAHTCDVPRMVTDGSQATDDKGRSLFKVVVIGSLEDMNPKAREAYDKLTGVSLCKFISGFGGNTVNDPAAIWDQGILAAIANKMTMILMGILLSAVMALYLAASAIEVHQRPAVQEAAVLTD